MNNRNDDDNKDELYIYYLRFFVKHFAVIELNLDMLIEICN